MGLDIGELVDAMVGAAGASVGEDFPKVKRYFEQESKQMASRLAMIADLYADGVISQSRAMDYVEMQKDAWSSVLLAVKGLTQLMVEEALNAALDAVREIVNGVLDFDLL
jgi:hypothetical protein